MAKSTGSAPQLWILMPQSIQNGLKKGLNELFKLFSLLAIQADKFKGKQPSFLDVIEVMDNVLKSVGIFVIHLS